MMKGTKFEVKKKKGIEIKLRVKSAWDAARINANIQPFRYNSKAK